MKLGIFRKSFRKLERVKKAAVKEVDNTETRSARISKKIMKDLAKFTQKIKTEYINTRDLETFIRLIKRKYKGKLVVVDIRWGTYFKSNQGFSPQAFEKTLIENDIEYLRLKALGNPFHDLYSREEFIAAKQDYLNYLEHNSKAREALESLSKLLRFRKTHVLICYCPTEDPEECHRFWVKEALINLKRELLGFITKYELKIYDPQTTLMEVPR